MGFVGEITRRGMRRQRLSATGLPLTGIFLSGCSSTGGLTTAAAGGAGLFAFTGGVSGRGVPLNDHIVPTNDLTGT